MYVAANLRRLVGSFGGAVRRDLLIAEDADGLLGGDRDQAAPGSSRGASWEAPA